jgi:uncharacterized protein YabE (DUF348 family)
MSDWSDLATRANDTLFARFGEVATYSRNAGKDLDAVEAFEVTVVRDTSGQQVSATSSTVDVMVRTADIPLGPQRGDQVLYRGVQYTCLPVGKNAVDGLSRLGLREI